MRVATFAEMQAEFLNRVQQAIYCNLATIDLQDRPRSRIVHPVWEESTGWIISWPATPKFKHIKRNANVSLAYIHDTNKPVYVEGIAQWITDRDEQWRVWRFYQTAAPPMGFDPEPHFGDIDHEHFGLLKIIPWRIELYTLRGESIIWQALYQ